MANLQLVPKPAPASDDDARQQALDIQQSWIVEAPAGSGKTGLLIQRFLKLLAADNITDPAQVLAITFTRKATVEMRDRVLAQLQSAQDATPPTNAFDELTRPLAEAALAQDHRQGWNLLASPHRLNIRTIDSVCADIARALPILSGASGALTPTEDSAPLHAEAARRTLMLLGGEDQTLSAALETVLLHRDANLTDVETLIASMLQCRDQWGELIPLAPSELTDPYLDQVVLPKLNKALDQAICRGLTRISKTLPAPILQTLTDLAADMGHAEGYKGNPSPVAICAGRYAAPEEKSEHLDHWRALIHLLVAPSSKTFRKSLNVNHIGFMILPEHKKQLLQLIDQVNADSELCQILCSVNALPPAQYPADQWPIAKALFRVLSRALIELQLVFAAHNQCDFAELGLLARAALRNNAAVNDLAQATGQNLQHLLVDEMQDTSTSQYELIQLLTQRWDGHSQTVFLVGDPKQSIYLFRQARVERFVNTMHTGLLGDLPLGILHLTANFRSQATLVQHFNQDFSHLFPPTPNPAQPELVPYLAASAKRPPTQSAARQWHTATLPRLDITSEATLLRKHQHQKFAEEIRTLSQAALHQSMSVAVLVRNRSHLFEIVAAFKNTPQVPFRAVEIEHLRERQEILDLLALTRALVHPSDRTAWLALLRAPFCGLTLADLHLLAGGDDSVHEQSALLQLIVTRGELLSEDGIARLQPFWQLISNALTRRAHLPIAQWVEQTWRSFDTHSFLSQEELANTDQFFALLDETEGPGATIDFALLDKRLDKLYAAPAVHQNAVDLLTIHKSKGLEWDMVFVANLDGRAAVDRNPLLAWLEVSTENSLDAHGILAPIQGKGKASQDLNNWIRSVRSAREAAERKRLFYVACTRAREELHLFASPAAKQDGTLSIPPASLLAAAWPAAEEHFQAHTPTPILVMPTPQDEPLAIAASAAPQPRIIQRIPLSIIPTPPLTPEEATPQAPFTRPEGSFASRAFGNTVHAFLDQLATQIAQGQTPKTLAEQLPTWPPRITHVLRASGLPPTLIDRLTQRVLTALRNTLADPEGQWLLASHPQATTESALISWHQETRLSIRMDRTFAAGPTPLKAGTDHLWIIDYKTAEPGGRDAQAFLSEEKQKYAPQLNTYATTLATQSPNIRLALYYPMLPKLIWWPPTP